MSEITTIAQAKESSLEKWNKILKSIEKLGYNSGEPCGFCYYNEYINKTERYKCSSCFLEGNCSELVDIGTGEAFNNLITEIEKVISFIENVKEES